MKKILFTLFFATVFNYIYAGATFDSVKKKGFVQCGINTGVIGFSIADDKGKWEGLDIDACRGIAAAIFGDSSKFKLTPLSVQQRFAALQSGEVDVLTRNSTTTLTRDVSLGIVATGVTFYDAQGILVKKSLEIKSAKELDGATICIQPGTTAELNINDFARTHNIKFKTVAIEQYNEVKRAFLAGRCDAFTTDKSALGATRVSFGKVEDYIILPEDLSKEPLATFVRQGDEQWFNIVRWSLNAVLEAEEYGINSKNVDEMLKSSNPNVQRILGVTTGLGKSLGLNDKWAYNIIKQVGNYGESFDKYFGKNSQLKLDRGLNKQWQDGGLMYGWPIR